MRKILSLVLAALMAFGSASFAAVNYDSVGNELKDLGVIKGKDDGTLATFDKLTKEEAIVIISRMLGKEAEAKATTAQSGFSDVPENSFYAPYIAWAKLNNITNGKSETEFGFKETVTTKVVATYMLRALGYVEEAKWTDTNDVIAQATKVGLLKEVSAKADEEIIRGEVFQMMHNTLYTEVKGEKQTLAKKLNLVKDVTSATLEVVDVKATNLKEIEVEFNQPVNKDTLKSAFTVSSLQLEEPKLQEDGKTVVLTVKTNMTNAKEYKLSISRVKSSTGVMMDKVTKTFTVKDVDAPTVVGDVKVTGPREFSIEFSEPVKAVDKAKIKVKKDNKTNVSVSDAKLDDDNNRVLKITLSSAMADSSEYTVSLDAAVEDYAGYKNRFSELSFAYVAVKDAPVAEISEANQKYVVVKFDRPVKGLTKDHFYHTYSSYKAKGVFASKEDMDKNTLLAETKSVDTVYVLFATGTEAGNYPLQEGDVRVNVLGSVSGKKIVDNWNNQLKDQELTVSVTADKESPVVEKVEVKSNKTVEVTFSKDIKSFTNTNVEFLTSDGKKMTDVSVTVKADSKKVYTLELSKSLEGKTVVLNIKDVRDNTLRENKLDGIYSQTISFDDKEFAGPKNAYLEDESGILVNGKPKGNRVKLYVEFSEAVDSSTAENIKNYKFSKADGAQFTIDADATISPDSNSVVVIDLGDKTDKNSVYVLKGFTNVTKVYVSNEITDLAGNKMSAFSKEFTISDIASISAVKVSKAEAVSKTEIKVTFEQQVKADDIKFANIVVTDSEVVSADFVEGENNKVVKLTLNDAKKLAAAPSNVTVTFNAGSGFTSVFGKEVDSIAVAVTDKIAPSVAKIVDDYKDVQIKEPLTITADKTVKGTIVIKADEQLKDASAYSINSVKVNGFAAKVISVSVVGEKLEVEFELNEGNGRTLVDNLKAKSDLSADIVKDVNNYYTTDLTVSIVDPLRDNVGNAVKDETTPTVYIEKNNLPKNTFDESVKEAEAKDLADLKQKAADAKLSADAYLNDDKTDLKDGYAVTPSDENGKIHGTKYVDEASKTALVNAYKALTSATDETLSEKLVKDLTDAIAKFKDLKEFDLSELEVEGKTVKAWKEDALLKSSLVIKGSGAISNSVEFLLKGEDTQQITTMKNFDVTNKNEKQAKDAVSAYKTFMDTNLKTSAPELTVTLAKGSASQKTKLSASAGSNTVYISKNVKSKSTDAFVVGDVLEKVNYVEISDTTEVSKTDLNSGTVDGETFAVVEVDSENKVVRYGFVTINESVDFAL